MELLLRNNIQVLDGDEDQFDVLSWLWFVDVRIV